MYSIKAVAQATGLSIETLRAWERRYRIVEPTREANGRRAYRPEDVIRLRKLREATERGHPISKLARLSPDELGQLLAEPGPPGLRRSAAAGFVAQMLKAAENYRPEEVDRLLAMALALLPVPQFVTEVLAPVLLEVGERWHRGEFDVAQERLVSAAARKQVSGVVGTYNRIATGPLLVLTTPAGERHELGLLMCALLAAARNARCHYLGPDLPAEAIATYAARVAADVVALSAVNSGDPETLARELHQLAAFAPERVALWIGGAALAELAPAQWPARFRRFESLAEFDSAVEMLVAVQARQPGGRAT